MLEVFELEQSRIGVCTLRTLSKNQERKAIPTPEKAAGENVGRVGLPKLRCVGGPRTQGRV